MSIAIAQNGSAKVVSDMSNPPRPDTPVKPQKQSKPDHKGKQLAGRQIDPNNDPGASGGPNRQNGDVVKGVDRNGGRRGQNPGAGGDGQRTPPGSSGEGGRGGKLHPQSLGGGSGENGGGSFEVADQTADGGLGLNRVEPHKTSATTRSIGRNRRRRRPVARRPAALHPDVAGVARMSPEDLGILL